jgi:hypothetical protein
MCGRMNLHARRRQAHEYDARFEWEFSESDLGDFADSRSRKALDVYYDPWPAAVCLTPVV